MEGVTNRLKSLRAKLFFSVGIVLFIVSFLNYWLSYLSMKRELRKASLVLNQHVEKIQDQIREFSSFALTYKIIHGAAELDGVSKIVAAESEVKKNAWEEAARIATYNPQIAFVQLGNRSEGFVVVSPESAKLYFPSWAPYETDKLWIKIPEKNAVFIAVPQEASGDYLLFKPPGGAEPPASFTPFENLAYTFSWRDPAKDIFNALLGNESLWVEKLDLIQLLAAEQSKNPSSMGVLTIDPGFKNGYCVLSSEVFSTEPVIENDPPKPTTPVPNLVLRKDSYEPDLDMVRVFPNMALGFSLSSLLKEMGKLAGRTILATWDGQSLGFSSKGEEFEPEKSNFPLADLSKPLLAWQGENYIPQQIDLQILKLNILIPEKEAMAGTVFLADLGQEIALKVTLSLIAAALVSFAIALLLLNRIARKITGPIHLLSIAAEELGKGKYDGLVLPECKKRHDEVEVLAHSFEKMVIALRDRDKIRGVLNKVVSKEITEEILKGNVELGGEERTLTLLFSDIRGFTQFSEHLDPKELIGLLNEYMTRMCRIIDETHGVVDKFVGDEIMALYGAPVALVDHPIKAIESAIRMIRDLRSWNDERKQRGETTFEIGIGIHTGIVCTGNMGAENRLNYTAIGANVNLASRLCGAAAPMQILISEETYQSPGVKEKFEVKSLPPVKLKGLEQSINIFQIIV